MKRVRNLLRCHVDDQLKELWGSDSLAAMEIAGSQKARDERLED